MQEEIIKINLIDLTNRRNVEMKEGYLTLGVDYVTYRMFAKYEATNDEGEWEACLCDWLWTRKREHIANIELIYCNVDDCYDISLEFKYVARPLTISFKKKNEATEMYNRIVEYWQNQ